MSSAFAQKVAAQHDDVSRRRARNPWSPEALLRWLRRHGHPVVGKLVQLNFELKRLFGDDAMVCLNAYMPLPYVGKFGGYVPAKVYFDLSVSLDGSRTGTDRSLFLEVDDNVLHSPRFGYRFDADVPTSGESVEFLTQLENEIVKMLCGKTPRVGKTRGSRQ